MLSVYINRNVSDIVREDYRTADVFKQYGINYCCGGKVMLKDICDQRSIEYSEIDNALQKATINLYLSNNLDFEGWNVEFLVDYIINVHHNYLNKMLPQLESNLLSFVEGHKSKNPELVDILAAFREISSLLVSHNRHEEEIIFPYIKQIANTYRRKETYGNLFVRTLRKPLSTIELEHKKIGSLLQELSNITRYYNFPEDACTNHQVIFRKLKEFDNDMSQHKYLENDILFPKAIEIEKELLRL